MPDSLTLPADAVRLIEARTGSTPEPVTLGVIWPRNDLESSGFDPERHGLYIATNPEERDMPRVCLDVLLALVPEDGASDLTASLQEELAPYGVQALVTTRGWMDFGAVFGTGVCEAGRKYGGKTAVVFFPGNRPDALLYARGTNGANYDLGPEEIAARLERWSARCSLRVVGAGWDWCEVRLETLPEDLTAFAQEVYDFCPDTLDQGFVRELPEGLSDEEKLEFIGEAIGDQDADDLADYLNREKRLFLWWD